MPKLLHVHQWGKYANIYATYELTGITYVNWKHCTQTTKMTMMKDDYDDDADDDATA